MIAKIFVTLKSAVLDPQGQAVQRSLARMGHTDVKDARIGKYIVLKLEGPRQGAEARVEAMCKDLLANTVIEDYRFDIIE